LLIKTDHLPLFGLRAKSQYENINRDPTTDDDIFLRAQTGSTGVPQYTRSIYQLIYNKNAFIKRHM